jgi:predicted permease
MILTKLLQIYLPLVSGVTIGWLIRPALPLKAPFYLGKILFWLGVPISVFVGYVGFPIILTLFGDAGFAWALFYDLLGTTVGAYGLGALIAITYRSRRSPNR